MHYFQYFIMALIEIGFFLAESWKELTATAIAYGIGIILGKRVGSRIAVKQFIKMLGLEKKSTLEQKVDFLMADAERRGVKWTAPTSKQKKIDIKRVLILLRKVGSPVRFVRFITHPGAIYLYQRRKKRMNKKFTSRKFWLSVVSAALVIANDGLDLGIDNNTVMAFAAIVVGWVLGESHIDAKRTGGQANDNFAITDEPTK